MSSDKRLNYSPYTLFEPCHAERRLQHELAKSHQNNLLYIEQPHTASNASISPLNNALAPLSLRQTASSQQDSRVLLKDILLCEGIQEPESLVPGSCNRPVICVTEPISNSKPLTG
ncbi:hypothetical protein BKA67DRAFT_301772 [Truncatella angustata]|uniref:Uncharacterized protein n=1 Tax=Truncatella angustata TaxID=152316 RepID=A0A9P8UIT9_9PEZI|nr:uncharacterized protein BKA67DRAFT_301772 [Truncatella angustata]KAH6652813.1 hypothetical protein BKA67DRAFT_301772 [Truncatella angustata]